MKLILSFNTRVGTFYIGQSDDGRFHPIYDDESLGSYSDILQAIDDLVNDATFSVSDQRNGKTLDTSKLGIPEDPKDWTVIRG